MKKNLLALTLLLTTLSLTSCNEESESSNISTNTSVVSTPSSNPQSTSTKKEFSIKKGLVNGNYIFNIYQNSIPEDTKYEDLSTIPCYSTFKISVSRGEEDVTISTSDFTIDNVDDGDKPECFVTAFGGVTLKDSDDKSHRVPYAKAKTDAVTLTSSDTYIIIRVAFNRSITDENTKIFYKGVEILTA